MQVQVSKKLLSHCLELNQILRWPKIFKLLKKPLTLLCFLSNCRYELLFLYAIGYTWLHCTIMKTVEGNRPSPRREKRDMQFHTRSVKKEDIYFRRLQKNVHMVNIV